MSDATMLAVLLAILIAISLVAAFLLGRGRRSAVGGRDFDRYRRELRAFVTEIDDELERVAGIIDALRRRDTEPDAATAELQVTENRLDAAAETLHTMHVPAPLHATHERYAANLERALRGVVVAIRGCGLTKLPHRPPDDEEPFVYYKRGHGNVVHAHMEMRELTTQLLTWTPAQIAEAEAGRQ
jgi:hypothetical protein